MKKPAGFNQFDSLMRKLVKVKPSEVTPRKTVKFVFDERAISDMPVTSGETVDVVVRDPVTGRERVMKLPNVNTT